MIGKAAWNEVDRWVGDGLVGPGFSTSALLTFKAGECSLVGAVLCMVRCSASLASTSTSHSSSCDNKNVSRHLPNVPSKCDKISLGWKTTEIGLVCKKSEFILGSMESHWKFEAIKYHDLIYILKDHCVCCRQMDCRKAMWKGKKVHGPRERL